MSKVVVGKVVVGSQLHGTATDQSDTDTVEIVVSSLTEVLSPFRRTTAKHSGEADGDHIAYEFSQFCKLLAQNNPTALEVLWSNQRATWAWPMEALWEDRHRLLDSRRILHAHGGYSMDQWTKLQKSNDESRIGKCAAVILRVLLQGLSLLKDGEFSPQPPPRWAESMRVLKRGCDLPTAVAGLSARATLEQRMNEEYEAAPTRFAFDADDQAWVEGLIADAYFELG